MPLSFGGIDPSHYLDRGLAWLGLDFDPAKLAMAREFGAETVDLRSQDALPAAERFSRGRGVDAVIITASTASNEPVHQAALMCRKRGRIVLVGVTGLELSRDDRSIEPVAVWE